MVFLQNCSGLDCWEPIVFFMADPTAQLLHIYNPMMIKTFDFDFLDVPVYKCLKWNVDFEECLLFLHCLGNDSISSSDFVSSVWQQWTQSPNSEMYTNTTSVSYCISLSSFFVFFTYLIRHICSLAIIHQLAVKQLLFACYRWRKCEKLQKGTRDHARDMWSNLQTTLQLIVIK